MTNTHHDRITFVILNGTACHSERSEESTFSTESSSLKKQMLLRQRRISMTEGNCHSERSEESTFSTESSSLKKQMLRYAQHDTITFVILNGTACHSERSEESTFSTESSSLKKQMLLRQRRISMTEVSITKLHSNAVLHHCHIYRIII